MVVNNFSCLSIFIFYVVVIIYSNLYVYYFLLCCTSSVDLFAFARFLSFTESISSEAAHPSFANIAHRVTLMNRFISKERRVLLARFSGAPRVDDDEGRMPVLEGLTAQGNPYSSILHPDNTAHLAVQGVYDDNKPAKSRSATANPAVKKAASMFSGMANVVKSAVKRQEMLGGLGVETIDESDLHQNKPRRLLSPIPYSVSPLVTPPLTPRHSTGEPPSVEDTNRALDSNKPHNDTVLQPGASDNNNIPPTHEFDNDSGTAAVRQTDTDVNHKDNNSQSANDIHDTEDKEQNNNVLVVCDKPHQGSHSDSVNNNDVDTDAGDKAREVSSPIRTDDNLTSGETGQRKRKISPSELRRQLSVDIPHSDMAGSSDVTMTTDSHMMPNVNTEEVCEEQRVPLEPVVSQSPVDRLCLPEDTCTDQDEMYKDKLSPRPKVKRHLLQETQTLQSFELEEVSLFF